jgi:excinuclease ABC subunit A
MQDAILLKKVRTHNLKGIDVKIPHRSLSVITGVSGSGKSSLAFDTLYAEGRRRYVESLSAYARQFLERIEKPDVDSITGILPAIAIEAKNAINNARSTVGTQTELNDYLRLLFARIGITHCSKCGDQVVADTPANIVQWLEQEGNGQEAAVAFPVSFGKKARRFPKEMKDEFERQGFLTFIVAGKKVGLEDVSKRVRKGVSELLVVLDELRVGAKSRNRLLESVENALRFGKGKVTIVLQAGTEHQFSNKFHCATCNLEYRAPNPNTFSFNSPLGACPQCQGFGRVITIDWNLVAPNHKRSIDEGVIEPWTKPSSEWEFRKLKEFCNRKHISRTRPFSELTAQQRDWILHGCEGDKFFSVQEFFKHLEKKTYKMYVRIFLSKYRGYLPCLQCHGKRLRPEALLVRVTGHDISELCTFNLEALKQFFDEIKLSPHDTTVAEPVLLEIRKRLSFLVEVGLGYLTLDRLSRTLSGGESQRIRLASSLGSQLVDTLYVLDEPSIGLHERDNAQLIGLLQKLKDLGNTVVVVEHDRTMIEAADQVIDLGLLGGERGGKVVFAGPFRDLLRVTSSHTARYFRKELQIGRASSSELFKGRRNGSSIHVEGAREHNLKEISAHIPLNQFTVVTGVSGSGKSTFIYDVVYGNYLRWRGRSVQDVGKVKRIRGWEKVDDVLLIDQSPIGRTPRSNPVTYLKVFDQIRKIFAGTREAKLKKLTPGHFSFNTVGGRCDQCEGDGMQKIEMHFLADVHVTCEACGGARYQSQVLDVQYKGVSIQGVLQMTIDEAIRFFGEYERIRGPLSILSQVGLGHLKLGQSATTLSGGEAQRLKLAVELNQGTREAHLLYLFDEPTTGLHYYDVASLLTAFDTLLARGHSVCVIEHNMEIIKCADHVIDLGPEGGDQGGRVIYEGPLNGILENKVSHTGAALKKYLHRV